MNKRGLLFLFLFLTVTSFAQVQLQFTTVNQMGNNLYIDNLLVGTQYNKDVAAVRFNNISADTSYAQYASQFSVAPVVTLANVGKTGITSSFTVTLTATTGSYSSTKTVTALDAGKSIQVTFDNFTITPGISFNLTATVNLPDDENLANNSISQFSYYLPGSQRIILLEEFTSSTCSPCSENNPTVDSFIAYYFDSLVAIKYHMNWPSPGNDPMYLYNPTQASDRRVYYGVNTVPRVIMDGVVNPSYPYTSPHSLRDAINSRITLGSPSKITVTNTRLAGDSIKTDITVQNFSPLKAGNYYLRVHAIERAIHYDSAPGTNNERDFYYVFRGAYPNSTGTPVPAAQGTYNFTFEYKLDMSVWVDTMIYTVAFIQNDLTREIINAGKSGNWLSASPILVNDGIISEKPVMAHDLISVSPVETKSVSDSLSGDFQYELFESNFPPAGWTIKNPDAGITFQQYVGANGPSIGGNSCVVMPFYIYSTIGAADTLYSRVFNGLNEKDSVKFNWAYAPYGYGGTDDRLVVKLSTDGGITFPATIFDKSGSSLATASGTTDSFVPNSSQWRTFSYPLSLLTDVVSLPSVSTVKSYSLSQNYPNPFNPSTSIKYSIPQDGMVNLAVYNTLGQKIAGLVNQYMYEGNYEVKFNASSYPSGIYFYRLEAGNYTSVKKMILMK